MATHDLTDQPPKRPTLVLNSGDPRLPGATPFWLAGIGVGVNVILSQLEDIDTLSQRISVLPDRTFPKRAVVTDYLDTIRRLSATWLKSSRPALLRGLRALQVFGDQLVQADAVQLRSISGEPAMRLLHGMAERLDGVAATLDPLGADIGVYLEQMALASGELETDTVLVTHRLQTDQVHAAMLSQQLETLESRLGHARSRQHGQWPLGAMFRDAGAEQLRREIASGHQALDSTRRQLEAIRADQADTLLEAAFLQQLLPTLSSYLAGIDRMGAGIDAVLLGLRALQTRLRDLAARQQACSGAITPQQLDAALPHWRHLGARLGARLGASMP